VLSRLLFRIFTQKQTITCANIGQVNATPSAFQIFIKKQTDICAIDDQVCAKPACSFEFCWIARKTLLNEFRIFVDLDAKKRNNIVAKCAIYYFFLFLIYLTIL